MTRKFNNTKHKPKALINNHELLVFKVAWNPFGHNWNRNW